MVRKRDACGRKGSKDYVTEPIEDVRLLKQQIAAQDTIIVELHKTNGRMLALLDVIRNLCAAPYWTSHRRDKILEQVNNLMNTPSKAVESIAPLQANQPLPGQDSPSVPDHPKVLATNSTGTPVPPQLHEQLIVTIKQLQLLLTEYHALGNDLIQKEVRHQVYLHNGLYGHAIFKPIAEKLSVAEQFLKIDNELIAKGKQ